MYFMLKIVQMDKTALRIFIYSKQKMIFKSQDFIFFICYIL